MLKVTYNTISDSCVLTLGLLCFSQPVTKLTVDIKRGGIKR